jgi:hypothetical protein
MFAVLASCGSSHDSSDVFAVKEGMTKAQVLTVAGAPDRVALTCWSYDAHKEGTLIYQRRFCFTDGRVSKAQTAIHLGELISP